MFTLDDGRSELWQWDTNRKLKLDDDCTQIHFSNKALGRSVDVDVVDKIAIIPDFLLQSDNDLKVWAFSGTAENGYTKVERTFKVNRRNKPADYVFTPIEQISLEEIAAIAQSVRDDADAGNFNGSCNWNDITNKPFGETTVIADALTWDGNTDGLYNVMGMFYHISESIPTLEELQQGGMGYLNQEGMVQEIPFDDGYVTDTGVGIIIVADYVYVVSEDGATLEDGLTFEKRGIYFPNMGGTYVEKMTINNYKFSVTTVKKIDPKFIDLGGSKTPNDMGAYFVELASDTVSWDLDVEGRTIFTLKEADSTETSIEFVHVSDAVPTLADFQNGGTLRNVYQESVTDFTIDDMGDLSELLPGAYGTMSMPPAFVVVPMPIGDLPKGVYLSIMRDANGEVAVGVNSLTINGYTGFVKRKLNNPIDTPVKTIAGIEPSANGDVPLKSLTPLVVEDIKEDSLLLTFKNIAIGSKKDEETGETVYYTINGESKSDIYSLQVKYVVRLRYNQRNYYHMSGRTLGGGFTFSNMFVNSSGKLVISTFTIDDGITYTEKTI